MIHRLNFPKQKVQYTSDLLFPFWKILLPFKNWSGMRRTTRTAGFLWSRFDVPRVFLALSRWAKSLKALGTRSAPSPQHLKQEKGKGRKEKGKSGSSQLVKTGEKEHALFSLWAEHIWYSQLGTVDCETLHLFTSKIDKAWEWTYNCLTGQYLSTNGLFGTIIGLLHVMFSVEFGLVMDTRIIEILWHKSILLQWLKNLVTCLTFDDIFFYI